MADGVYGCRQQDAAQFSWQHASLQNAIAIVAQFAMTRCLIGLGANLGDRAQSLSNAIERLAASEEVQLLACSHNLETAPVGGPPGQATYLNAAALIETALPPERLLRLLQEIESQLGRQRLVRWDSRTIDLDLLLYDQQTINTPRLTVPHPRLAVRRFVLEPAAEIAGGMRDPATGWTIEQLWQHLLHAFPYVAIAGPPGAGKTWLAEQLASPTRRRLISDQRSGLVNGGKTVPQLADSSGRAIRTEIEFLAYRRRLLSRAALHPTENRSTEDWLISDFWLDQSRAWAARLDTVGQEAVLSAWQQAQSETVRPKLLIVLAAPPASSREMLRLADELDALSRQPNVGPVLRLRADDREAELREAEAALRAMQ